MQARFDSRINFLTRLIPIVLAVESLFPGKGRGAEKKDAINRILSTNVDISRGYNATPDPKVKAMQGAMIDQTVANLTYNGLLPATDEQRLAAGVRLGKVKAGAKTKLPGSAKKKK